MYIDCNFKQFYLKKHFNASALFDEFQIGQKRFYIII